MKGKLIWSRTGWDHASLHQRKGWGRLSCYPDWVADQTRPGNHHHHTTTPPHHHPPVYTQYTSHTTNVWWCGVATNQPLSQTFEKRKHYYISVFVPWHAWLNSPGWLKLICLISKTRREVTASRREGNFKQSIIIPGVAWQFGFILLYQRCIDGDEDWGAVLTSLWYL